MLRASARRRIIHGPDVFDTRSQPAILIAMQLLHSEIIRLAYAGVKSLVTFAVYGSSVGTEPAKTILETVDENEAVCFAAGRRVTRRKNDIVWAGGLPALCTFEEVQISNAI